MKYLLLFSILSYHISFGQLCSKDSLFNRFRNDIQIELSRHDNRIVWDNETKLSFYRLMIDCPVECLAKYVDDSIPSIRAIVFGGLAQKDDNFQFLEGILNRHRNDTAIYLESPTDVVTTWTVREYMQTILKWKADKKIPNEGGDFKSRLETLQADLQKNIRINIPGEYHGIISKESVLSIDSITCSIVGFRILSCEIIITDKIFTSTNILSEEIKNSIRDMKDGEILYIENVIVEFPDKTIRKISPLKLELR